MNFWEVVDSEREYKNISRKELAYLADFSINSIPTGITRGSIPAADVAYRIAKVLDVTVEYLLLGGNVQSQQKINENNKNLEIIERSKKYTKNHELIDNFEKLPNNLQKSVEDLIQTITNHIQN
ncbi:MAG: helix-turn-helix transcriptional regulator [Treponema sp.]|jgi:transcriptional regulator with XRE-family HTH domain|nr:helix-turn-helix transcriptional regulator [Treponema sp.]